MEIFLPGVAVGVTSPSPMQYTNHTTENQIIYSIIVALWFRCRFIISFILFTAVFGLLPHFLVLRHN